MCSYKETESTFIYIFIFLFKSKYKKAGVLPIRIVWSNVSSIGPSSENWSFIRIGSTPTFLYFDLYLYSAYTAHYVYIFLFIIHCSMFNVQCGSMFNVHCLMFIVQYSLFIYIIIVNVYRI